MVGQVMRNCLHDCHACISSSLFMCLWISPVPNAAVRAPSRPLEALNIPSGTGRGFATELLVTQIREYCWLHVGKMLPPLLQQEIVC